MPQQYLLEGEVDPTRARIRELESYVERLELELSDARSELMRLRIENTRAITSLRQQLTPLYRALRAVFEEMDAISGTDAPEAVPMEGKTRAVWESWKSKLGGSAAKVIDALLLHGEMNTQQLAIAVGLHRTTIPAIIYRLNQAGLINKNSGRFSLKGL